MTRWRYGTIALLLVAVESPMAFADWDVQDSIAGIIIHISWPLQPENAYIRTQHLLQSRSLVLLSRRLAAMNTVHLPPNKSFQPTSSSSRRSSLAPRIKFDKY